MRKMTNKEHIEGYLYDCNLSVKTVQNTSSQNFGKEFINGTIDIQTDEEGLNIVTIHYSYVTEFTSKGTKNDTFFVLKNLIDNGKKVVIDGKDSATKLKADTALSVNDFYTDRNGEEVLISSKRNEGGFIQLVHELADEKIRNTFEFDCLINGYQIVEADEEKGIDADYMILRCAVFNFKNAIMPVDLTVRTRDGMTHFEQMGMSPANPVLTKVWGKIQSQTIVNRVEDEAGFGEPSVREYSKSIKEWSITGGAKAFFFLDDEAAGYTKEDLKKAGADREVYLADVKRRSDEYKASKDGGNVASLKAASGGFNF